MVLLTFSKSVFIGLALTLLTGTSAAPVDANGLGLEKRADGGLKLDFEIVTRDIPSNSLAPAKRSIIETLLNKQNYYAASITVGSNNQKVTVDLDTGSSDLWVVATGATCQPSESYPGSTYCLSSGTFNHAKSTTAKDTGEEFHIEYGDLTTSDGEYYTDSVSLGGATVKNVQLGVVSSTSVNTGVFGIGPDTLEAADTQYKNFPDLLVQQGLISSNYYSLYLDGPTAASGSVIFGGIDSSKYSGSLIKVPVVSKQREEVTLGSISHGDGSNQSAGFPVLLDSGTTVSYFLPDDADAFASHFDNLSYSGLLYTGGCNVPAGSVTFNFANGAKVKVPYSNFLLGQENGECVYGFGQRTDMAIFGDNFLRYAYLVYDLSNQQISIAQSKFT